MASPAAVRQCLILMVGVLGGSGCFPYQDGASDPEQNRHFQAGKSLVNSLDFAGAAESFEKALESNPRSPATHFELGVLFYQHLHDYAAAIFHFERYLRYQPDAPHAENVRQFINVCKQELAKTVSLGPVADKIFRDLDGLRQENDRLRRQVETLGIQLKHATQQPAQPASSPQPALAGGATPRTGSASDSVRLPAGNGNPAANPGPAPARARTHVIQRGDTLAALARQYRVRLSALEAANPGVVPKRLQVGQVIRIPPGR